MVTLSAETVDWRVAFKTSSGTGLSEIYARYDMLARRLAGHKLLASIVGAEGCLVLISRKTASPELSLHRCRRSGSVHDGPTIEAVQSRGERTIVCR